MTPTAQWIAERRRLVEEGRRADRLSGGRYTIIPTTAEYARLLDVVEALDDARKRLQGAGMLGGGDDPVNTALRNLTGGEQDTSSGR